MARCELESSTLFDTQADELRRTERAFVCIKGKQLDSAAVVQRRDDARRLLEHAVRQGTRAICNFHRGDPPRDLLNEPIQLGSVHRANSQSVRVCLRCGSSTGLGAKYTLVCDARFRCRGALVVVFFLLARHFPRRRFSFVEPCCL